MNLLRQPRETVGILVFALFLAQLLIWIANGIGGIPGVPDGVKFVLGGTAVASMLGIGVVVAVVLARHLWMRWHHQSSR